LETGLRTMNSSFFDEVANEVDRKGEVGPVADTLQVNKVSSEPASPETFAAGGETRKIFC